LRPSGAAWPGRSVARDAPMHVSFKAAAVASPVALAGCGGRAAGLPASPGAQQQDGSPATGSSVDGAVAPDAAGPDGGTCIDEAALPHVGWGLLVRPLQPLSAVLPCGARRRCVLHLRVELRFVVHGRFRLRCSDRNGRLVRQRLPLRPRLPQQEVGGAVRPGGGTNAPWIRCGRARLLRMSVVAPALLRAGAVHRNGVWLDAHSGR
jgi:hypothetical protein